VATIVEAREMLGLDATPRTVPADYVPAETEPELDLSALNR
jgi:hypothetical protein